ncbi:hypothetical protein BDV95DRAFT_560519 [Massariosphaeria phaeospora]|uniref:Uncharacterized protein n=1 Tax=Massariosphaeria phaeospora TaxID=100035 RepID=A0A7C8IFA0_9PLEO|nr:hypothetical protein BDV95DRAFT_560519 [Massariosphaeria phaeospora]
MHPSMHPCIHLPPRPRTLHCTLTGRPGPHPTYFHLLATHASTHLNLSVSRATTST